jgi:hypothetical protein
MRRLFFPSVGTERVRRIVEQIYLCAQSEVGGKGTGQEKRLETRHRDYQMVTESFLGDLGERQQGVLNRKFVKRKDHTFKGDV